MNTLFQIVILTGFLLAGGLIWRLRLAPPARYTDQIIKLVLRALLALMGFRLGNSRALFARLPEIGLMATITAAGALLGTILLINLAYSLFARQARQADQAARSADRSVPTAARRLTQLRDPGLLLLMVVLGAAVGLLLPEFQRLDYGLVTGWVLNALLFMIGIQFAQSGLSLKTAFVRLDTLLVPLATVVGTLLGSLPVAWIFGLTVGKALSLGAGFGWYSLSGVIISNLGDPLLGAAAFLANLVREAAALLLIPFLAAGRYPYTAIGAGGATAMDVTSVLICQTVEIGRAHV